MTEIIKPTSLNSIWAVAGDKVRPTETKIQQGWGVEIPPRQWVNIPRTLGLEIGKVVGRHVQTCFSWCKGGHEKIDALELSLDTLESVFPVMESINTFGMSVPQEEPTGEVDESSN